MLIGAGGSARAVGASLVDAGCGDIVVANRTPARGEALAIVAARRGRRRPRPCRWTRCATATALADARLVVNTTPVGLAGTSLAVRFEAAPRRCLFVDLVYGATPVAVPASPPRRAGRPTLDGAAMLLHQGALAFECVDGPACAARRHGAGAP